MNRKPWMPQTLTGWVGLIGKACAFLSVASVGVFHVGTGALGIKEKLAEVDVISSKVEVVSANVDTLTVEMVGVRADMDGLAEVFKSFTVEMRCVVDKFVEGETLGYRSCVPKEANGGES